MGDANAEFKEHIYRDPEFREIVESAVFKQFERVARDRRFDSGDIEIELFDKCTPVADEIRDQIRSRIEDVKVEDRHGHWNKHFVSRNFALACRVGFKKKDNDPLEPMPMASEGGATFLADAKDIEYTHDWLWISKKDNPSIGFEFDPTYCQFIDAPWSFEGCKVDSSLLRTRHE